MMSLCEPRTVFSSNTSVLFLVWVFYVRPVVDQLRAIYVEDFFFSTIADRLTHKYAEEWELEVSALITYISPSFLFGDLRADPQSASDCDPCYADYPFN